MGEPSAVNYTGMPDIYSDTYRNMTKLWKDSFSRLNMPWVESALTLSRKRLISQEAKQILKHIRNSAISG